MRWMHRLLGSPAARPPALARRARPPACLQIFADGSPAEYTPIGEWVRETSVYNMMKQLAFFRNYMSQVGGAGRGRGGDRGQAKRGPGPA